MSVPPTEMPPIPTLPPGEVWTAERVRAELIDERHPSPRYEFIDGELLVSSSPAYAHQRAVGELFKLLDSHVGRTGVGEALLSPSDVELAANNTAQPDVHVIPPAEGKRLLALRRHEPARHPLLAVEILSPSTARYDQLVKRRHCVRNRVEYRVVDLDVRAIARNAPYFTRVLGPGPS